MLLFRHTVALPLPDGLDLTQIRRIRKALRSGNGPRVQGAMTTIGQLRPLLRLASTQLDQEVMVVLRSKDPLRYQRLAAILDQYFPGSLMSSHQAVMAAQTRRVIPEHVHDQLRNAIRMQEGGQHEAAIALLSALVDAHPTYGLALHQRAICYRKLSMFVEAEADLRLQLRDHPQETYAMLELGKVLGLQFKDEEAIEVLHEAVARGHRAALMELGMLYRKLGKNADAAEAFLIRYKIEFDRWRQNPSKVSDLTDLLPHLIPALEALSRRDIVRKVSDIAARVKNGLSLDVEQAQRDLASLRISDGLPRRVVAMGSAQGMTHQIVIPGAVGRGSR